MEEFKRVRKWRPDSDSYARRTGRLKKKMKPRTKSRWRGQVIKATRNFPGLWYWNRVGQKLGWQVLFTKDRIHDMALFTTGKNAMCNHSHLGEAVRPGELPRRESLLRTTALIFPVWSSFLGWEFWNSREEGLKNLEASRGQLLPLTFRGPEPPNLLLEGLLSSTFQGIYFL